MSQCLGEKDAGPATERAHMSHLQEAANKTYLSEALSTSGGALKQLFMSPSQYVLEPTEKSRRFTIQTFLSAGFQLFLAFKESLRLWL